jgi:hypothetical protein
MATLGSELERDRLERRVRRARLAIAVLREHDGGNRYPRRPGGPPKHLRHAISDFESQIETMNARLRDLAPERASTPSPAMGRLR